MSKTQERYEIGFLLRGETQWGSGHTLASDEQSAITNFLKNFSPTHGTLVAVFAHLDDDVSLQIFKRFVKTAK